MRTPVLKPESGRSNAWLSVFGRAYVNGNILEGDETVTKDNWAGGVQVEIFPTATDLCSTEVGQAFPMAPVTLMPAEMLMPFT